ncbi:MAG: DUF1579 domain-containing protein [Ferruginibacter sp.]
MKKISTAVCFFMLAVGIKTSAQNDGMKAWQDYMTPGDVHKMIAKYDGTWNEDVTFWMQPGAPATNSKATCVNTMILGGRYQQSTISGNMMGMSFEGFSLLGYDNTKKVFTSTWLDNMGTGTLTLEGTWDDATKTIVFKGIEFDPMSSKDINVKETIQLIDDNTQKIEMFMESPTGEFKSMEIISTRSK